MDLTETAQMVLEKRYLLKNESGQVVETPEDMLRRVAEAVALAEAASGAASAQKEWGERFYEIMAAGEFLPNSPTLMNAGTSVGQLSACFVVPVGDSISEIFEALKNMAVIHQSGGGTGFGFSRLRPEGDIVQATHGIASGPLSFMKVFDTATTIIKQGGRRRGANMGILRVDHPDIFDFIKAKEDTDVLNNFNLSVAVTDSFMDAAIRGKDFELVNPRTKRPLKRVKAAELLDRISEAAWQTGDPGLFFINEANRHNPTPALGRFESTNPCISGDSLVSTDRGLLRIDEIVRSHSGSRLSIVTDNRVIGEPEDMSHKRHTGTQTNLLPRTNLSINTLSGAWFSGIKHTLKIITKCGYEIEVTPDHKIMTTIGWKQSGELIPGKDRVLIQSGHGCFAKSRSLPIYVKRRIKGRNGRIYSNNLPFIWSKELGWVLGWLIGDGWLRAGDKNCRVGFVFSNEDKPVLDLLKPILNQWYGKEIQELIRDNSTYHLSYHSRTFVEFFQQLGVRNVKSRDKRVPTAIFKAPKQAVVGFLQALFSADGTVGINRRNQTTYIRLSSASEYLLKDVQKLLLNLGVKSRLYDRSRISSSKFLYVDKEGRVKSYRGSGQLFELQVSRQNISVFLKEIGFLCNMHSEKVGHLAEKSYYADLFEDTVDFVFPSVKQAVYDLSEPVTHSFIANGFVISNCGEQPLLPFESCNLGSLNLASFISDNTLDSDRLAVAVQTAVRFLDDVIDVNKFPLVKIAEMTRANRKIGLGVMGFAEALVKLGISYGAPESFDFAGHVMRFIQDTSQGGVD